MATRKEARRARLERNEPRSAGQEPEGVRGHVFLSFSRRHDRARAEALREELISAGETVWWEGDILPGQDRELARRQALRNADAVVLCLSEEAVRSQRSEIFSDARAAIAIYRERSPESVFLIPARFSQCTAPSIAIDATVTLDKIEPVDLFPAERRRAGLERLLHTLQIRTFRSSEATERRPRPQFGDAELGEHSRELTGLYDRRRDHVISGKDTEAIDNAIREKKRKRYRGPNLSQGDRLRGGRFELIEKLGKGGFGEIWKAYDEETHDCVALKVLFAHHLDERTKVERFLRGARWMAHLQHQNIVRVIEPDLFDEEAGWRFFSMELIYGPNLERAVLERLLTLEDGLRIIHQIGRALRLAHAEGIVHRDVKPSNILLDENLQAKLTDFDLVRADGTETPYTKTAQMMGTFNFAAPELLHSAKDAGPPADVYSLACTAVFVLLGERLPTSYYKAPENFIANLDISSALSEVLIKATSEEPSGRYEDAGVFDDQFLRATREIFLVREIFLEEMETGTLRYRKPAQLADHVRRHPEDVGVLARSTSAGELAPAWAEPLLSDDESSQIWLHLVEHVLSSPDKWKHWERVPYQILDRFLERPLDSPKVAASIQRAGDLVQDDADVEILIRLAEIQHRMCDGRTPLLPKTREMIRWLERRALQSKVLEYVLSDEWLSLPRSLAVSDNSLRDLPWLDQHEDRLLEHPGARKDLATERLLRLTAHVGDQEDLLRQILGEIDTRMARDAAEATQALVRTGWWPYWRRLSRTASPSAAALAWLSCDAWQETGTPEATYEAWRQALEDTARLSADQVRRLFNGGAPRWPWIQPFEEEQIAGLGALCQDVDALVALIQWLAASPRVADLEASPAVLATLSVDLDALGLGPRFDADGLLWLIDERLRGGREAPVLPLEASRRLYERTELCREQGALPARIVSVLAHLDLDPGKALEASKRPNLWPDERFLRGLAAWISSHQGIGDLGRGAIAGVRVARAIEELLPSSARCSTGGASARLLGELKENGCEKICRFLRELSPEKETADRLIDAICRNDTEDAIWGELTYAVQHRRRDKEHPLAVLAGVIQGMSLTPEQRSLLEKNSWPTVDTVASQASHPSTFFGSGFDKEPLPLFELIRSLRFAGSPGDIAAGIVAAGGSARYRKAAAWWKQLLLGCEPSRTGFERLEDDPARAMRVVELCVENLSAPEQRAWQKACTELSTNSSAFNYGDVS